ncbi:MAG: hypothetical protein HKN20_10230 [Gemmatimonadetes bacterium]|nr:hypothetical protein [Gemmatimonadota bacterium]
MTRIAITLILVLALMTPRAAHAEENAMLTVSKTIVYGGLAGLILGSAIALAADDNEGDIIKWSFVAGTFAGLGVGIHSVSKRGGPSAVLSIEGNELAWNAPSPAFTFESDPLATGEYDKGAKISLLSFRTGARP